MKRGFQPVGRTSALATIAAAVCLVVALAATAATGQGRSTHTIVLMTSVTAIDRHGRATVTARVSPGSLVPPHGTVKFINRTTHVTLGVAPLRATSGGPCTLGARSCSARLSVSGRQLVMGANRIVGLFDPQKLYFPSFRASTWLYRGVVRNCRAGAGRPVGPVVFTAGASAHPAGHGANVLCRARVTNPGGANDVVVSSRPPGSGNKQTVIAFGSQTLPCSTRATGDLLAYSISGSRAPGSLAFRVFGRQATVAHRAHPRGFICYESTIRFTTASGGRPGRTANGSYFGSLPHCRDNDQDDQFPVAPNGDDQVVHPPPCIEWQQYTSGHGRAQLTTWIEPTPGDPRLAH